MSLDLTGAASADALQNLGSSRPYGIISDLLTTQAADWNRMAFTHKTPHDLLSLEWVSKGLSGGSITVLESLWKRSANGGLPCYLVGGPVRDRLLDLPLQDLDVSVEGDATELAAELAEELGAKLIVHRRFGTATLKLAGDQVDLVTARKEVYSRPGALPKVSPGALTDDLARRDFSINALALPMRATESGVIDPHGGLNDMANGIVRTLRRTSFFDDPTRMLRAVRYEQRLGFDLDNSTLSDLSDAVCAGVMTAVSGDRCRRELDRVLNETDPGKALIRAVELRILAAIHPALSRVDILKRIISSPNPSPSSYLVGLVYPLSKTEGEAVIGRLKLSNQRAKLVRDTIWLRENEQKLRGAISTSSKLAASLAGVDSEALMAVAVLADDQQVRQGLQRYIVELRTVSSRLSGKDLLAMGVVRGPKMAELLGRLLTARLDGLVETVDDERTMARKWVNNSQAASSKAKEARL